MQEPICCFIGHHFIPEPDESWLMMSLDREITYQIERGGRVFAAGGALGFDTMAALNILLRRMGTPGIRLQLVLPYPEQAARWREEEQLLYERIKRAANEVEYVCPCYTTNCMLKRNRALVDRSAVCVAYLTREGGGTAYTVDYCRKKDVPVRLLSPRIQKAPGVI